MSEGFTTIEMNSGRIECFTQGAAVCKKYVGAFAVQTLAAKAETGLWYCTVQGQACALEGSGTTPRLAIVDTIKRTESQAKRMMMVVESLKKLK